MIKFEGVDLVQRNLDSFGKTTITKIAGGMEQAIAEAESTAKIGAPWTDRTGNARNSITGSGPEIDNSKITTALCIGVYYGVFLELCYFGKYRIVWPTLEWIRARMPDYFKNVI